MTRPLAVVTGASSGIGFQLACQFAANGFDLVRAADEPIPAELDGERVQVDLATPDGVLALYERLRGRPVEAIALNHGITARSDDLERELALIDLNVRSTVHLARLVSADMAARGRGRMLFTSSLVAALPGPYQAAYDASKSFVQSFATALRHELRDSGVTVTLLMPGPTDTPIFARARQLGTILGAATPKDDPADVARQGVEALMSGRDRVAASSLTTKATELTSRVLPEKLKARLTALLSKPRSSLP